MMAIYTDGQFEQFIDDAKTHGVQIYYELAFRHPDIYLMKLSADIPENKPKKKKRCQLYCERFIMCGERDEEQEGIAVALAREIIDKFIKLDYEASSSMLSDGTQAYPMENAV